MNGKGTYGTGFTAGDIQAVAPNMNQLEAEDWIDKNGTRIVDALVDHGWEVIIDLLKKDGIKTDKSILE
jgi:hypothetical protein